MFPSSIRNAKREIKPTYTETIMEIQAVTLVFKLEITIMEIYVLTIVLNRKYNALLYITFYVQFVSSFFLIGKIFQVQREFFFFFFLIFSISTFFLLLRSGILAFWIQRVGNGAVICSFFFSYNQIEE